MSSVLKREFKEKDVNRIRNLVNKKHNDKTGISVGYDKKYSKYSEGDVWEENGKKWTIKNGIKQNVTKLDALKKSILFPLACPCCSKQMDENLDKKFYNFHGKCFNCVVQYETQLKIEGKYEEYEKNILNKNINSYVGEIQDFIDNLSNENNSEFVTEYGEVEKWDGGDTEQIKEKLTHELDRFKKNMGL